MSTNNRPSRAAKSAAIRLLNEDQEAAIDAAIEGIDLVDHPPEHKKLRKTGRSLPTKDASAAIPPAPHPVDAIPIVPKAKKAKKTPSGLTISASAPASTAEGCRICCRDEDHSNLLLCEACDDEYHTYCLQPPLKSVPEDDWFCGKVILSRAYDIEYTGIDLMTLLYHHLMKQLFVATQTIVLLPSPLLPPPPPQPKPTLLSPTMPTLRSPMPSLLPCLKKISPITLPLLRL
jgi:hypothetical protein